MFRYIESLHGILRLAETPMHIPVQLDAMPAIQVLSNQKPRSIYRPGIVIVWEMSDTQQVEDGRMSATDYTYFHVPYHVDCEVCGERIDGVIIRGTEKEDLEILGDTISSFADAVGKMNVTKYVEEHVKAGEWDKLLMPYGPGGHACPHCGARQSWDPMVKMEEPAKEQTASSKAGAIGCTSLAFVFAGMVLGLIAYIIQNVVFYESDPLIIAIFVVVGVIAGVVSGIWANKKTGEELDETYDKRMEEYQEYLATYEAFEKEVAARASHNKPIVDLTRGLFYGKMLETPEELAKAYPDARPNTCPNCGKKLEGKVLAGSLSAKCAADGRCPWCGADLPPSLQVRLTTA